MANPTVERQPVDRRVLIVAYYFPPMGFSGVQRVAKFARYLPRFGWHPTVLTVDPGGYFAYDTSLQVELEGVDGLQIRRTSSLDPTRLFGKRRTVTIAREERRRLLSELSQWFFLPDNKIGWAPHAIVEGNRILRTRPFDAIMSSAPPYTCHLVASVLSRRFRLPLLLDYRDDWLDNPRHVYPTPIHRTIHRRMERYASRPASRITTINRVIAGALRARLGRNIDVLEQGFDPADFVGAREVQPGVFRLSYTGVFYDAQKPDTFLRACAQFLRERPEARADLRIDFAGTLPAEAQDLAARLHIDDVLTFHGYLPHDQVVQLQQRSAVLWMTIGRRAGAESISTGKVFEYIGARRPILGLVPEGAAAELLSAYNLGEVADPDDPVSVARAITRLYDRWRDARVPEADASFVSRYDRVELTRRLAGILDSMAVPTATETSSNA